MAMSECSVIPPYAMGDLLWHHSCQAEAEVPHDACLLCRHCLCPWPGKKMSDVHQLWRAQLGAQKGDPCILGKERTGRIVHKYTRHPEGERHFSHLPSGTTAYSGKAVAIHLGCYIIGAWQKNAEKKEVSPGTQALATGTTALLERY